MDSINYAWIKQEADSIYDQLVTWRRHFHRYPELGFQEYETGNFIVKVMAEMGLDQVTRCAQTGVVGMLSGKGPGPTVAVRADMDALPILEETGLEFASQHHGCMHACGHDAHMAIVLGTAKILAANRQRWDGSVKFIFQPAEECPPGGAKEMIQAGVLKFPEVKAVLGLHVTPLLPAGQVGFRAGTVMAAADNMRILIHGKSGHGAAPHQTIDPIVTAAQAIMALQTIASRRTDPLEPVVVTIGSIHGGSKANIIAPEVELTGTVRTLREQTRRRMPELLEKILQGITAGAGATYQLDYLWGYPPTVNDAMLAELFKETASSELGAENVQPLQNPSMAGEDFAYYAERVPGLFYLLGAGRSEGLNHPWHHAGFNIAEQALQYGVRVMTRLALEVLNNVRGYNSPLG